MSCDRKEITFTTSSIEDMRFIVDSMLFYAHTRQQTVHDLSYVEFHDADNDREIKVTLVVDFT